LNEDATIEVDSFAGRKFTGKVVWISPKAEFTPKNVQTKKARADLVYAVKIELANPDNELKIGMPADIVVNK
jgi:HlyD family secretion protein